jgi:PAS domain S-box-containing protein
MRNVRLAIRILLGTGGIIIALGLAMIFFVRTDLREILDGKLQKRGISITRHIAQVSINPILTERFIELELLARDYRRSEDDIVYIFFLNHHGEIVAHTFDNGFPVDLKRVNRPEPGRDLSIESLESEKGVILDIAVPLLQGGAGTVHLGISKASIKKDVDEILTKFAWIVAIIFTAGIVFAALLSAAITRPVNELAKAAQAVERGDLTVRVKDGARDEIGILGRAFNSMIEARTQADEELRNSEKKLRDITSSLGMGLLVVNTSGRLEFMNPEAERLLGWTEAELTDRQLHDVIHVRKEGGAPMPAEECLSMGVLKTGERAVSDDDVFVRKDGSVFPVAFVSAPVIKEGMVVAVAVSFRDITNRKRDEAEREQLLLDYKDALANIKTLKGLMPICSSCKKIRDDKGYWNHIEAYIRDHSEVEFSHGICPDCAQKLYPKYYHKNPP